MAVCPQSPKLSVRGRQRPLGSDSFCPSRRRTVLAFLKEESCGHVLWSRDCGLGVPLRGFSPRGQAAGHPQTLGSHSGLTPALGTLVWS